MLATYGPTRDRKDLREMITNPESAIGDIDAFRKLPDYIQSMLRNEAVPFKVEAGAGRRLRAGDQVPAPARRGAGGGAREAGAVLADLRPDHHGRRAADRPRRQPARQPGLRGDRSRPCTTPTPTRRSGPYFLPWTATDARFFRTLGVPTYGFSPFLIMNTDTLQVDRPTSASRCPPSPTASTSTSGWSAGWSLTLSAKRRCQNLS